MFSQFASRIIIPLSDDQFDDKNYLDQMPLLKAMSWILPKDPLSVVLTYCSTKIEKCIREDSGYDRLFIKIIWFDDWFIEFKFYPDHLPDININGWILRPWHRGRVFCIKDGYHHQKPIINISNADAPKFLYLERNALVTPYGKLQIYDDRFEWHVAQKIQTIMRI